MIVIYGGAYNGKLEYVKNQFNIEDDEIFFCKDKELDFSKKVICGLHKFTYNNALDNVNSLDIIKENINKLQCKIIICDEISSGIVPLKKEERIWREDTGKCLQYLSKNSNTVIRVFCGIPTVIKNG